MISSVPTELLSLRQSDLGTVQACGRKLYLSKVAGLPRATSAKMLSGTAFHRGLESLYTSLLIGDPLDLAEAKKWASESLAVGFALAGEAVEVEEDDDAAEAADRAAIRVHMALDHYVAAVLPGIAAVGRPLAIEYTLELEHRGFNLSGTVDLIDGAGVLRDHKLVGSYLSKEWPDSYLAQLTRYLWFLDQAGLPVTEATLDVVSYARAFKKTGACIEHAAFTLADAGLTVPQAIRLGEESVNQALDLIEAGAFGRTGMNVFNGPCGFCPYKGAACLGV